MDSTLAWRNMDRNLRLAVSQISKNLSKDWRGAPRVSSCPGRGHKQRDITESTTSGRQAVLSGR